MEELADDVGGGSDAEDDGAEDLLPPGQQQHGVLSPAALTSCPVSLYQAYSTVTFPPVELAVGEVAVVYREETQKSDSCKQDKTCALLQPVSRIRILPYGY